MTVAEVHEIAQAFHDGVADQDPGALSRLYGENAIFMPPGMPPCEGCAAIEAAMQGLMDMGARSLDIEPIDVREAGDMTIEYGRYTLGLEPEGGEAMTEVGKYVVVHETRENGTTKILLDCFNSNSPPSA
jgi:ketosteroid isomerase-like protein